MESVRIAVDGRDEDFDALWDWLREEPQLRGRLRLQTAATSAGTMGAAGEILVQVGAAMAGAGALWAAVAQSLSVWLTQRRSDVTITVTGSDGRRVSVDAKRVADADALLRDILPQAADE